MTEPTESVVLFEVPAAEAVVADVRRGLDPAAALGVPAHVTALFPFVAPDRLDDAVRQQVAAVAAATPAFELRLISAEWFGDTVLWLAPADPLPFRRVTAALAEAFPDHPPYAGVYDDVVPHLTVGQAGDGVDVAALRAAESVLRPRLPIVQRIDRLAIWVGSGAPDSWRRLASYALRV